MPHQKKIVLSIIIPVYNEEKTIDKVIDKVKKVKLAPNIVKEIIVIDDGSTDNSRQKIIRKKQLDRKNLKVHFSLINLGKGAAVRVGLKFAKGDLIIIQDADLELDPKDHRKIIEPIIKGEAKVVYGSRFLSPNPNIPQKTRLANWFLTTLVNLLYGSHLTDMETAYKAFAAKTIKPIRLRALEFEFEPEMTCQLLNQGTAIMEVPIKYRPRTKNEGKKINFIHGIEAIYTIFKIKYAKT